MAEKRGYRREGDPQIATLYSSIKRVGATDAVVQRIEELILGHHFLPGEPLPSERELAEGLGVGRNVIRESIKILGQRKLVEVVPGRGTFVVEANSSSVTESLRLLMARGHVSLKDLGDARLLIEPELASLAAHNATGKNTGPLLEWLERLDGANGDVEAHVQADAGLHREIARLSNQKVFQAISEAIHDVTTWSMRLGMTLPGAVAVADTRHHRIVEAVIARDSELARQEMREHMRIVIDYTLESAEAMREWMGEEEGPS